MKDNVKVVRHQQERCTAIKTEHACSHGKHYAKAGGEVGQAGGGTVHWRPEGGNGTYYGQRGG